MPIPPYTYQRHMHRDTWRRADGSQFSVNAPLETVKSIGFNFREEKRDKDYKVKISKRQDATNDYYTELFKNVGRLQVASCTGEGRDEWGDVIATNAQAFIPLHFNAPYLHTWSRDAVLRDIALGRLKNRIANEVEQYKALAPIAELREARTLFRSLSSRMVDFLLSLHRFKKKKGLPFAKWVSGQWLEFSFAVSPMVADIGSLLVAAREHLFDHNRAIRLTGSSGTKGLVPRYTVEPQRVGNGVLLNRSVAGIYTLSYRFVSGFDAVVESASGFGWDDRLGLTWRDVPGAAYELIPFSWLLDYFTTTGAYLNDAFQVPPGMTRYVVENRRYVVDVVQRQWFTSDSWMKLTSESEGLARSQFIAFERKALQSIPTRSLRLKTLNEIGVNEVVRLLNLTALLVSSRIK